MTGQPVPPNPAENAGRSTGTRDGVPKLLFVLPSLGGGGAERASVDLLRGIDRQRFHITLALFARSAHATPPRARSAVADNAGRSSGTFLQELPGDVPLYDLRGKQSYDVRLVWRLAGVLRREKPDVVFSVLRYTNLITLLASRLSGSAARVVVNEQNPPSAEFALFGGGRVKAWFLRRLYPWADRVTAISTGIARELVSTYGVPQDKVQVIPNPVDLVRVRALAAAKLEHPWFSAQAGLPVLVAVGRLHPQKGFAHLIRAFSIVRQALPCKLVILGEGPLRTELEGLIASLGLTDDVALPGFQENPYNYMSHSAAFVLSSLFEGFGNVLVDALALGVPVVSTRCPVGPEDIITDGVTGVFVPPADEEALAQAILRVLQDGELRRKLLANGPLRAADFAIERIVPQYEALFERLSHHSAGRSTCPQEGGTEYLPPRGGTEYLGCVS
jgi:glycosyltransferase involved in cell wall biosynthesis